MMASRLSHSLPAGITLLPQGTIVKEGLLQKRQRGRHVKGQDYSGLKFQPRLIRLDTEYLYYYAKDKPKSSKGKFEVISIEIVEEVEPPSTFSKGLYYFQIGSQYDIMYFGADTSEIRSEWIKDIRTATRNAGNKMISHYHPGVYGKGEWTCCKAKVKDETGCHETTLLPGYRRNTTDSLTSSIEYIKTARPSSRYLQLTTVDSGSDSGRESMTSLSPTTSVESIPNGQRKKGTKSVDEIGESYTYDLLQVQYSYHLLFTCQYESALTALDFRGANTLIAAEKSGKVHVLDVYGSGERNLNSQEYDNMHFEVKSVETWKNLFLISAKNGSWCLRDLDNRETDYSVPTHDQSEHFVAFTPDGSRIITANKDFIEVLEVNSVPPDSISTHSLNSLKLQGNPLLLSVSPDPSFPKAVVGIAKNERLVLCVCDYTKLQDFREIDIGCYQQLHTMKTDFSSEMKLAIGHGNLLTIVKTDDTESIVFSMEISEVITSLKYSPIGDDLMVGLSNGSVEVLDGRAIEYSLRQRLEYISSQHATTSLTFSKDCSLLALGQNDGKLTIIKRSRNSHIKSSRIITVPSSGDTLRLNEDDITVNFPPGFTSQPSMSFDYDVMIPELFGPECFPPGVRPVSAILKLHPHNNILIEFEKSLEITLPHFADLKTDEDNQRLAVFKACSGNYTMVNRKEVWNFNEIQQNETNISLSTVRQLQSDDTEKTIRYATFYPKHCCFYCIGMYQSEQTDDATFCLTRALKLTDDCPGALIHYCLYYDLPTCAKMVRKQYSENSYSLKHFDIKFNSNSGISGIGIKVLDTEILKDNGWEYSFENCSESSMIYAKGINFWAIPSCQLQFMCDKMSYPPRYILKVFPASKISTGKATSLMVEFPGAVYTWFKDDSIILTVQLEGFRIRTESSVSTVTIASEDNLTQTQGYEISAVQSAFRFISESEELPQPYSFALELNSNLLLKNSQMDSLFPNEDKIEEHQKTMKNYKILRAVQENISEDSQKFKTLCSIFRSLGCKECLQKLTKGTQRHKLSESEKNEDIYTPRSSFSKKQNGNQEFPESTKSFPSFASSEEN